MKMLAVHLLVFSISILLSITTSYVVSKLRNHREDRHQVSARSRRGHFWILFAATLASGCEYQPTAHNNPPLPIKPIAAATLSLRATGSVCEMPMTEEPCEWISLAMISACPIKRDELLTGSHSKTWHIVLDETCDLQMPFDFISINVDGTWQDSNGFSGIWRQINSAGEIVFASKCNTVRCTMCDKSNHRLSMQLHDWSPGLIVDLVPSKTIDTQEQN